MTLDNSIGETALVKFGITPSADTIIVSESRDVSTSFKDAVQLDMH